MQRRDLWITTKVWIDQYSEVEQSVEMSLKKLQTEYVDLLLLHWPTTLEQHEQALDSMMKLQDAGKIKHIGVSNFTLSQLEHVWDYT